MAELRPFHGLRYGSRVELGLVLSPPYDVIDPALRRELLDRDPHNFVRIELGEELEVDEPGRDRYSRAAETLTSWEREGILQWDAAPSLYVVDHEFRHGQGPPRHRLGLLGLIAARPWESAPIRPHERTLRGPREDRLALLRATGVQTSPVFGLWDGAPGLRELLDRVAAGAPAAVGRFPGEQGDEEVRLWAVSDPSSITGITRALVPARLYVADGHHRYETAAAAGGECLVLLSAADDPALALLPTHRLVRPAPGVPRTIQEVAAGAGERLTATIAQSWHGALRRMSEAREQRHAFAVLAPGGSLMLSRARSPGPPRRETLDVSVLETELLAPWGITPEAVREGVLRFCQDTRAMAAAVASGEAAVAIGVNACTVGEMMAVADSGETMPQKSTYFHPKVPAGLVMASAGAGVGRPLSG